MTALAATILFSASAEPATIKLATWNLNNLHHVIGEPLRDRAPARSQQDYATLREYRDRVGADIYALQEVNGPKAAALVFPPDEWDTYFSGRYVEDLVNGRATNPDAEQRSDRIYTGFAVRRGVFDAVSKRDVPSLGVIHAADGRRSDGAPKSSWRRTGSCSGCSVSTSNPDATAASKTRPLPTV